MLGYFMMHDTTKTGNTKDGDTMKIHLGYIATPLTLDYLTYAHTITYTNYLKIPEPLRHKKLTEILSNNLKIFEQVLYYNYRNSIFFYRFSHNLVPLATHPQVDFDYITPFQKQWRNLGTAVKKYHIRLDSHPDQFCVLNSVYDSVLASSRLHLDFHYRIFQAMGIKGKTVLHIGGMTEGKELAKKRFINTFQSLPIGIQNMIILENDDKIFMMEDVLELCQYLHVPMVLDYHHYQCHHQQKLTKDILLQICATWDKEPYPPKMHFSSPRSKKDFRSHSEYLNEVEFRNFLMLLKEVDRDIDIMLECKGRDMALFKLTRQLKCDTTFHFINDTTFYY